ncbi:phasin protein [Rhodovulum imhoffii]|uniref:Phasin protein n=1 Tax=Rhodovulum imhoffii TaxID=365340 RepID=A0A2T5BPR6_9RHOB|nr:phasin family protein [Rhodovulum imhoffii]PTN01062.1 phasin protein [Rhodovulum imhoffii]
MAQTDSQDPFEVLQKAQAEGLGILAWLGGTMLNNMARFGTEFTHFAADRLQKDLEAQQALMACRDPQELARLQAGFLEAAMTDYAGETGKVLQMGDLMLRSALRDMG